MKGIFARIAWAAFQPKVVERKSGRVGLQFPKAVRFDNIDAEILELLADAIALPGGIESASVTPAGRLTVDYDPDQIDEPTVLSYLKDLGEVIFENYQAVKKLSGDDIRRRMQSIATDRPTREDLRRVLGLLEP